MQARFRRPQEAIASPAICPQQEAKRALSPMPPAVIARCDHPIRSACRAPFGRIGDATRLIGTPDRSGGPPDLRSVPQTNYGRENS